MTSRIVRIPRQAVAIVLALLATACAGRTSGSDEHAGHGDGRDLAALPAPAAAQTAGLPADATTAEARLRASTRHAEYATIRTGATDSVRAWVVYPERRDRAPVVVVIHEIFGLSTWIRAVADQLAADGYIAIAPDLLTGRVPASAADSAPNLARQAIQSLRAEDVQRQLAAVGQYGMSLPAAQRRYGVVGYCWGGSTSFMHAVASPPGLGAAVVYYGTAPSPLAQLASVRVPVLGLYGGNDARVTSTVAPADSAMRTLGKSYAYRIFDGAGHGFLRQQRDSTGANLRASQQAWPLTIGFFRQHLGR
jgi:carboxymethylenebutenolidase